MATSDEWFTPAAILGAALETMGAFDLDPAWHPDCLVQAAQTFTQGEDGLARAWQGRVWLNPPYSQPLCHLFVDRAIREYEEGNITEALVLVNNATETRWFQRLLNAANGVCFLATRVKFWRPGRAAPGPRQGQAIFYFGKGAIFHRVFAQLGTVLCCSRGLHAPELGGGALDSERREAQAAEQRSPTPPVAGSSPAAPVEEEGQ